jgi:hypothetical protein
MKVQSENITNPPSHRSPRVADKTLAFFKLMTLYDSRRRVTGKYMDRTGVGFTLNLVLRSREEHYYTINYVIFSDWTFI